MRADNRRSDPPYRATEIWQRLAQQFDTWFALEGIGNVESQEMNRFFSSPHPGDVKLLRYATWLLYRDLKARDHLGLLGSIPATAGADSGHAFEFEGHLVSWDQLISLDSLYSILETFPALMTEPVIVADIGAGWGRMGYVLKRANPRLTYVVFDLPEVLLVSSTYLPRLLPAERHLSYPESRMLGTLSRDSLSKWGCVFLAAQDLERCEDKSIDIAINIASFQEMTRQQLSLYFNSIERKVRSALYSLQLWKASTHAYDLGEVAGIHDYPIPPHWRLAFARNTPWSDLYCEATYQLTSPP
jgi:putative sugar O-methyltransferase